MDDPADVSRRYETGRDLLDGCGSTRNRKVEGSNPSSGSKSARSAAWLACFAWSFPQLAGRAHLVPAQSIGCSARLLSRHGRHRRQTGEGITASRRWPAGWTCTSSPMKLSSNIRSRT